MGLCVFSLPISLVMIDCEHIVCVLYLIVIIKPFVIVLGLGHKRMVYAMSFYVLSKILVAYSEYIFS